MEFALRDNAVYRKKTQAASDRALWLDALFVFKPAVNQPCKRCP